MNPGRALQTPANATWMKGRLPYVTPINYIFYVDGQETYRANAGGVSRVPSYIMLTEEIGNFGIGPDAWGTGPITNVILPDYYLVE